MQPDSLMEILKIISIIFLLNFAFILIQPDSVVADAKVDGFFRENLVKEGYFARTSSLDENLKKTSRPSFFISREERRINPTKAPSNNIALPKHSIRLRSSTLGFPTPWGQSSYSSGILVTQ